MNSIVQFFPIDRRRSFFAWVLVMTFVLFYKMVEYIFEIGMEGSCIDFVIKNGFLFSLVLIANIAHFIIYSMVIKSKLNYIINNQGLLVSYLNKYYMVPWCVVSKVNREIGRNGTNLHIALKSIMLKDNDAGELYKYLSNRNYVFKGEFSWLITEKSKKKYIFKCKKKYQIIIKIWVVIPLRSSISMLFQSISPRLLIAKTAQFYLPMILILYILFLCSIKLF